MSCQNSDNDTGTFWNSNIQSFEIQTEDTDNPPYRALILMSCQNSDNDTGTFRNSNIQSFEIQTEDTDNPPYRALITWKRGFFICRKAEPWKLSVVEVLGVILFNLYFHFSRKVMLQRRRQRLPKKGFPLLSQKMSETLYVCFCQFYFALWYYFDLSIGLLGNLRWWYCLSVLKWQAWVLEYNCSTNRSQNVAAIAVPLDMISLCTFMFVHFMILVFGVTEVIAMPVAGVWY